jgi:hypothetical protein
MHTCKKVLLAQLSWKNWAMSLNHWVVLTLASLPKPSGQRKISVNLPIY